MKRPYRLMVPLLTLAGLSISVATVKTLSTASHPAPLADGPSRTAADTDVAPPSKPVDDEGANRTEYHSLSRLFPRRRTGPDLAALLAVKDPNELSNAVGHITDNQCLQAFRRLQAQPASEDRDRVLIALLVSYAEKDRPSSLAWLFSMANPDIIEKALKDETFQLMWSRERPEETARWLVDQGPRFVDSDHLATLIARATTYWVETDPRAAVDLIANLPEDLYAKPPLTTVMRSDCKMWSIIHGVPTVLEWARTRSADDPRRTAALLGAVDWMASSAPEQAKAFVQQQLGVDKDALQMVATLGIDLSHTPEDAARWALSLSDPSAQRAALDGLVKGWITNADLVQVTNGGFPKAAVWAGSLPSCGVRGAAWGTVASYWKTLRPEDAKNWLYSLPDGPDRNEAIMMYEKP